MISLPTLQDIVRKAEDLEFRSKQLKDAVEHLDRCFVQDDPNDLYTVSIDGECPKHQIPLVRLYDFIEKEQEYVQEELSKVLEKLDYSSKTKEQSNNK